MVKNSGLYFTAKEVEDKVKEENRIKALRIYTEIYNAEMSKNLGVNWFRMLGQMNTIEREKLLRVMDMKYEIRRHDKPNFLKIVDLRPSSVLSYPLVYRTK